MNLIENVPGKDLNRQTPKRFHPLLEHLKSHSQLFDVVILSTDTRKVIKSAKVKKSLEKFKFNTNNQILFLAGSLTQEAVVLIKSIDGLVITLNNFMWSDDSYEKIRTSIGSSVKINYKTEQRD